jgi:hypothetical protein
MNIGQTYIQEFQDGERLYFVPEERCKNGHWKGRMQRRAPGRKKPSAKVTQVFVSHPPLWTELKGPTQ